jgi:hypothetical protein
MIDCGREAWRLECVGYSTQRCWLYRQNTPNTAYGRSSMIIKRELPQTIPWFRQAVVMTLDYPGAARLRLPD